MAVMLCALLSNPPLGLAAQFAKTMQRWLLEKKEGGGEKSLGEAGEGGLWEIYPYGIRTKLSWSKWPWKN